MSEHRTAWRRTSSQKSCVENHHLAPGIELFISFAARAEW